MAKSKNLFSVSGKVGNVVFYERFGKTYVRTKPVYIKRKNKTEGQLITQKRFKLASKIIRSLLPLIRKTYKEVKEKSMNLGLDLKGGISVILQISVQDILKGLANDSNDPVFNKALADAHELQKDSQNSYLEDFFVAFDAIKGDTKLASPDIFADK